MPTKKTDKNKVKAELEQVQSLKVKAESKKPTSKKIAPVKTVLKPKENLPKRQEVGQVSVNKAKEIDKEVDKAKRSSKSAKKQPQKTDSKEPDPKSGAKTPKTKNKVIKVPLTKRDIISKGMSARKTFTLTEQRYGEIKDYLTERGDEYDVVISGTTEKLRLNNRTYVPFNSEGMVGSGYHLANVVKADIKDWLNNSVRATEGLNEFGEVPFFGERYGDDWLEKNKSVLRRRGRDYSEHAFNLDAIEKNIGKVLVSIDINDCYWQTAFNQGWFTEKTYLSGLKKKSWKVGRNASIGTLCKVEMITTYRNGVIARDSMGKIRRKIIRKPSGYQYIRHNIIGYVCDRLIELANILGDDFFMYLTDCVFTTMEKKAEVEAFFKHYGYTCKFKTFEFTNLYRDDRVVEWVELKEPDTPKYYRYSYGQLYIPKQIKVKTTNTEE